MSLERLRASLADRYRIERELGAGGMATVYLAEDLRHDRQVALKVLKPELAAVIGAARFLAEIKTTANLQHPHILPLHDSGEVDGTVFYVMPFVTGESLRERIRREKQLPVAEATRIAGEVAGALDYAHRHGVIHRDIKPENILLHDGQALVADFGIALAAARTDGSVRMTETGMSLGTPHYMSPEQAMGERDLDARTDVYALGCVLYEMLTGEPPFNGPTAQAIVAKVMSSDPEPVTTVRRTVPRHVAAAVHAAIQKLPADRFASAREFAAALAQPASGTAPGVATEAGDRWRRRFVGLALASLATLLAVTGVAWRIAVRRPADPVTRLDLSLSGVTVSGNSDVVVSPDGSMMAVSGFVNGEQAIYLRRLGGDPEFRKLPGTEGADGSPSFSPDSRWIAFRRQSDHRLVKLALEGSGTTAITQGARTVFPFAHWGTPEALVYHGGTAVGPILVRVDGGGAPDTLGLPGVYRSSFLLPDGSGILYTRMDSVFVMDFQTRASTLLVPAGRQPWYARSGHLLYVTGTGGVAAVRFDLKRHRIMGTPALVIDRVASTALVRGYTVSDNGVLVYHEGANTFAGETPTLTLLVSLEGGEDTLRLPPAPITRPRFSPDGMMVAYEGRSGRGVDTDLYTFDLVTGTNTRLTFGQDNDNPVWSPDGRYLAFTQGQSGVSGVEDIYIKAVDNSSVEQLLLSRPRNQNPMAWLPGDTLLFTSNEAGQLDVYQMSVRDTATVRPYLDAPWDEADIQVSPDGRLAAFESGEAGGSDIWIRDFPVPRGKWQVSANQLSSSPRWSRDGRHIYYWRTSSAVADTLFRAQVDRVPTIAVRAPEVVLVRDVEGVSNWDLHPDGRRVLITLVDPTPRGRPVAAAGRVASRYLVVQNWFEELRARVGR